MSDNNISYCISIGCSVVVCCEVVTSHRRYWQNLFARLWRRPPLNWSHGTMIARWLSFFWDGQKSVCSCLKQRDQFLSFTLLFTSFCPGIDGLSNFASSTHKTIKNNNKNYYCLYTTGSNHCYCLPWCFLLIPALCLFALLCCSLFKHSGKTLSPSVLLELQQELSEWWHNGESEAKVENSQQRRRRRNQPEHLWTNIT